MKNIIVGSVFLLLVTSVVATSFGQNKRYNVLFIAVDDMNDYVSVLNNYPGLKTPNLEKFAKTAITFKNAYCAAPACNPSRASILTGLSPATTGIYRNNDYFQNSSKAMAATLMPEHYKKNGYRTMWSGKIFHTSANNYISRPGQKRMEAMWDDSEGHDGGYGPWPAETNLLDNKKWFNYKEWTGPDEDFADVINTNITINRLQQEYKDPFFMALGFYRPHTPWTAPKRFFDMYPIADIKLPKVWADDLDDIPAVGQKWAQRGVDLKSLKKEKKWKYAIRAYLASISFMDYNLGRVLDALNNSPYADNTIVVLWADHGFHMGEKHHFTKFALWEQTTHTLLMIKIPGVENGETRDQPVNLLDLYPTLLDYCNLSKVSQQLDGKSLRPVIEDARYERAAPSITYYIKGSVGIRIKDWHYIHYYDGSEELYHIEKDPREWHNLANDATYQNVKRKFYKWIPEKVAPRVGAAKKN